MPYIPKTERKLIDEGAQIMNVGQLNYAITKLCLKYLYGNRNPRYQQFNDVIGVLECAKQEIYRRFIVPYEEYKLTINGDIERDWEKYDE